MREQKFIGTTSEVRHVRSLRLEGAEDVLVGKRVSEELEVVAYLVALKKGSAIVSASLIS